MELSRLLARLWRSGFLGVGVCLVLVPFVGSPQLPAGLALGLTTGVLSSWLLISRLRRLEGQSVAQATRNIQVSYASRFSLAVLALLIAYKNPQTFHLLATGLGLISAIVLGIVFGYGAMKPANDSPTSQGERGETKS